MANICRTMVILVLFCIFAPNICNATSERVSAISPDRERANAALREFQRMPSPATFRYFYTNLRSTVVLDGEERVIRPFTQDIFGAGSISAVNETVAELTSNREFIGNFRASMELYYPRIIGSIGIINHRFVVNVETALNLRRCSGVLIADNAVLTALHCHCQGGNDIRAVWVSQDGRRTHRYPVRDVYGFWREPPIQTSDPCKRNGAHFTGSAVPRGEDLALVLLVNPVPREVAEPIVDFATREQLQRARAAIISGYGRTEHDGQNFHDNHQEARATTVILQPTCQNCAPGEEFAANQGTLGANNDSCHGDSGGPLFLFSQRTFDELSQKYGANRIPPDEFLNTSQIVLAGIVSRAMHQHCGDGGIYTDLTSPRLQGFLRQHSVNISSVRNFVPFRDRRGPRFPSNSSSGR